ncbi:LSU ribosomal protein L15P [Cetobacterium ceti]|uniref:Large ribosomal subunit protein uL15 n=1 Tax=Cetobacterium ceti TaxID=180163 RepID=A0A1T4Q4I9_9FUSO|nr:50S ribosomal protein L15 [Cetobacterium ceti]SJZ98457.1 LSU ribosomal protein L15P [Cetobacterium ceti]
MKLNQLQPSVPKKDRKRVGRGESSGLGKTAGKGSNGQKSRAGASVKPYFEGGQMPLYRRVPKRGFSNSLFRKDYAVINLSDLNRFEEGTEVTPELLVATGIVKKLGAGIKVLGNGSLEKKVSVKAHKVSESAKAAVEAKGGSVEIIEIKSFADVAKNN